MNKCLGLDLESNGVVKSGDIDFIVVKFSKISPVTGIIIAKNSCCEMDSIQYGNPISILDWNHFVEFPNGKTVKKGEMIIAKIWAEKKGTFSRNGTFLHIVISNIEETDIL